MGLHQPTTTLTTSPSNSMGRLTSFQTRAAFPKWFKVVQYQIILCNWLSHIIRLKSFGTLSCGSFWTFSLETPALLHFYFRKQTLLANLYNFDVFCEIFDQQAEWVMIIDWQLMIHLYNKWGLWERYWLMDLNTQYLIPHTPYSIPQTPCKYSMLVICPDSDL